MYIPKPVLIVAVLLLLLINYSEIKDGLRAIARDIGISQENAQ